MKSTESLKTRVLFVGGFKRTPDGGIYGGQVYACRSLIESPLSNHIEWILLDGTQITARRPPLRKRLLFAIARIGRFLFLLIGRRPEYVLIFTSAGLGFFEKGLMTLFARMLRKHVVLCPRSGIIEDDYRNSRFRRYLIPIVLRQASVIICQGERWKTFFQKITGLPEDRLIIIGNSIQVEPYSKLPCLCKREPVTVLFMGRLEANKGIFDLLSVADRFRNELETVRFLVCGEGPEVQQVRRVLICPGPIKPF